MRMIDIEFPDQKARCVFPTSHAQLPQAVAGLNLKDNYPVIVLIGGYIQNQHAEVTLKAIETVAKAAEDNHALIISGGSDMGIMASIGQVRVKKCYNFPLLGVTLESMATWPEGPQSKRFLWWGKKRWPISPHYSHFILVPGDQYGDDSPWIAETAQHLSNGNKSVTILANGGSISRKDISLSLEYSRPVIALAGTGRLADEMAQQPDHPELVTIVQADDEITLTATIREALQNQT